MKDNKEDRMKASIFSLSKMNAFSKGLKNKGEARKAAKKKMQDRLDAKKDD